MESFKKYFVGTIFIGVLALCAILLALPTTSGETISSTEDKVRDLENRLYRLETRRCELRYVYMGPTSGYCFDGSFVTQISVVNGNWIQVTCGRYEIVCN